MHKYLNNAQICPYKYTKNKTETAYRISCQKRTVNTFTITRNKKLMNTNMI